MIINHRSIIELITLSMLDHTAQGSVRYPSSKEKSEVLLHDSRNDNLISSLPQRLGEIKPYKSKVSKCQSMNT